jgi:hypothetical protein
MRRRRRMRLRARLDKLERRERHADGDGQAPPAEIWLPQKDRDGRPPGRYPCSGSNAVLVIYAADDAALSREADA